MRWRLSTRSARRGDRRWWIGAVVLASSAAAAAYLFDPDRGRARRTRIAERTARLARRASRRVVQQVRYLSGSLSQRVRRLFGAPPAYAQGRTFLDRVESEPAPKKLAALLASSEASAEERWPEEPPPDVDSEIPLVTAGMNTAAEKE